MAIALYDSLTRRKQPFAPLDPSRVGMYVCGPTVYDRAHIGNARAVVVFDMLYRLLRERYGAAHVRYVRNITDIDDRIIAASRESGEEIATLTERMTRHFHEDMAALDALTPDAEPRATEHIPQMIAMVERLLAEGCAYVAEGHVLFAVGASPHYGELSRKSRAELIDGARVEVAPYKRDPADFVLWKPSSADLPGWESPWGRGRPGWHIECSAMSEAHLGETFDIHGGGVDLIFPHHENELAQSLCAHQGRPFVRYWVHNGFLTVDGAKMSKSLGNSVTVEELRGKWSGGVIRLGLLGTHYRDPLDWTEVRPRQAQQTLDRFYRVLEADGRTMLPESATPVPKAVLAALEDDLNTPLAIAHLHDLAGAFFRSEDPHERGRLVGELTAGGKLMGLLDEEPRKRTDDSVLARVGVIFEQVEERSQARRDRDYVKADRIRSALAAQGIILEDHPDGATTWRRER